MRISVVFDVANRFVRRHNIPAHHIALAIVLVALGLILLPQGKPLDEARRAIGGSLLAVGVVGILYDYLFVRRTIGSYFELLKAAAGLELDRIYPQRSMALPEIAAELRTANGSVKIMCISGSDFFGAGPLAHSLSELIDRANNVHLRFLLLDPRSPYASLRAWVEEKYAAHIEDQATLDNGHLAPEYGPSDFNHSTMRSRMSAARAGLEDIFRRLNEPTKLSVRFYHYQPSLFIVAVNRWVFVELYHQGVDEDYRPTPGTPCIAKRIFILKFKRQSFHGSVFENHFDRVWRCQRTRRILPRPPKDKSTSTTP